MRTRNLVARMCPLALMFAVFASAQARKLWEISCPTARCCVPPRTRLPAW